MNYREYSDEDLAKLFANNANVNAFSELYTRYYNKLSKYISWLSGDLNYAKDIVQNIFLKLYANPSLFNPSRKFKTWIYVCAKNQWSNENRNRQNRLEIQKHQTELLIDTSDNTLDQEKLKKIYADLDSLSHFQKDTFILKYSSNLSLQEISEVHGCSIGTVKSRLFYAIKNIKKSVKDHEALS